MPARIPRIALCLWFQDNQAEAAVAHYLSIFPDARKGTVTHTNAEVAALAGQAEGNVLTIDFELDGQHLRALNGGAQVPFNEANSLVVHCDSQEEIDHFWNRLGEGGDLAAQQCGWLKDRYGVSWQIVPRELTAWMSDTAAFDRVLRAWQPMVKLDLAALRAAAAG